MTSTPVPSSSSRGNNPNSHMRTSIFAALLSPSGFLFLSGCLYSIEVNFIGKIYGTDIALSLAAFYLLAKGQIRILSDPLVKQFMLLAFIWLGGAILSDIYNHSRPDDFLRGWARIILFTVDFAGVMLISGSRIDRIMAYAAGLSVAQLFLVIEHPTVEMLAAPWKFGYGPAVTLLAVTLSSLPLPSAPRLLAGFVFTVATWASLALNARSLFGTAFLASVASWLGAGLGGESTTSSRSSRRRLTAIVLAALVLLVAGSLGVGVYSFAAARGFLGTDAQDKYIHDEAIGTVFGGRSESIASLKAITDAPLLGHGSWPRDLRYVYYRASRLRELGVETKGHYTISDDLIPTHSYFLGSWVEAGIFGAAFWMLCSIITLRGLLAAFTLPGRVSPFAFYTILTLAWDIPFSFFGGWTRLFIAFQLSVCVILIARLRSIRNPPVRT